MIRNTFFYTMLVFLVTGCSAQIEHDNEAKSLSKSTPLIQPQAAVLTNHVTESVTLQLANTEGNPVRAASQKELFKATIANDMGKIVNQQSPEFTVIAEKSVLDNYQSLMFVVTSYLNSLDLRMSDIVFFQHQYTFQEIQIIEGGTTKQIVMIPVDFSLNETNVIRQLSTIVHEMIHIEGAYKAQFVTKPASIRFREEYEAHRLGICTNFWVNGFGGQILSRERLSNASIDPVVENYYEKYSREALHLEKLDGLPEGLLISAQARALVIQNFNYFNINYCDPFHLANSEVESMYESLKKVSSGSVNIFLDVKKFN
ncbi:hypothetical protein [Glaciecola sp. 33A]|jgi:hypothetical protein|uniref:hypothetical protein n=1 Tax=Glaciecola sp. 33A TaxID=2057807 RepID=UPI000C32D978|nr:hypothetical protein [Glaciecola sp. 33A]PKI03527.1 hypothetical protein CXF81_01990 [Glaciecola sp. 33A]